MRKGSLVKHALALAGALLFLAAFCFPVTSRAQTQTNVTATVLDPLGIPYANGTYSIQLIPSGTNPTVNGQSIGGAFNGSTDANGKFNVALWPNASISPAGTHWQFTVCVSPGVLPPLGTGGQCSTPPLVVTIAGATQNLSAALSAVAPQLTTIKLGGGSVTSASCGNLVSVFTCSVATPTTTPAFSFLPVSSGPVLDCSQFPGADAGAKINACLAALSGGTGIADATKFGPTATISTAIVNSINATIASCGTVFTQSANILLSGAGASWWACPHAITTFNKAANIDQFTVSAASAAVLNVSLNGKKGSGFTGNGIVTAAGAVNAHIENNSIDSEANDDIKDVAGSLSENIIEGNTLTAWGVHGYESGNGVLSIFHANILAGDSTASGSAVLNNGSSTLANNNISDSNGAILVDDSLSGTPHSVSGNYIAQKNGWTALSANSNTLATANLVYGGGSHGPAILALGSTITANSVTVLNADGIDGGNFTTISANVVTLNAIGVSGSCAISLVGDVIGLSNGPQHKSRSMPSPPTQITESAISQPAHTTKTFFSMATA